MRTLLSFCFVLAVTISHAQDSTCQKIGFADTQFIVVNMPEFKQMEADLASLGGQLENQLKSKYTDYKNKVNTYVEIAPSISVENRKAKEIELMHLQESIRKFEREAELSYRKKQEQLMEPIYLKIGKSIDEVATENKYSIIINADPTADQKLLLFAVKEYDITRLVLKKMGISVREDKP